MADRYCPGCFAEGFSGGVCSYCGYAKTAPGNAGMALGSNIILGGKYRLGRVLGMGGFGITYLAQNRETGQICAIKEFLPLQVAIRDTWNGSVQPSSSSDRDIFERGLALFGQEASLLSGFTGNPSIVQVWDFFQQNGTAYFVMEYLDGVTLKHLIMSIGGVLPYRYARPIIKSIGRALEQVHRRGMLHRDVSPENIMITKTGESKLIDFGATRYFVGDHSKSLSVVLKPGFAPPEQYSSKGNQGPWVDVYALAATYYYAMTGIHIPDATDRLAGISYTPIHKICPQVDISASRALDTALALNYRERYQDIGSFIDILLPRSSRQADPPPSPQSAPPPPPRQNGAPWLRVFQGSGHSQKWLIPMDMELIVGCSGQHSNIVVPISGGSHVHCSLRYDGGSHLFYLRNLLPYGAFLADGTQMVREQNYTLRADEGFYLVSRENLFQVGVE